MILKERNFDVEMSLALRTQAAAYQAKMAGEHSLALSRYKQLLQIVIAMESTGETGYLSGFSLQLCNRAIELEEEAIASLPYLGE